MRRLVHDEHPREDVTGKETCKCGHTGAIFWADEMYGDRGTGFSVTICAACGERYEEGEDE